MNTTTGLENSYEWPNVYVSRAEIALHDSEYQEATDLAIQALEYRNREEDSGDIHFLFAEAIIGHCLAELDDTPKQEIVGVENLDGESLLLGAERKIVELFEANPSTPSKPWYLGRVREWLATFYEAEGDQRQAEEWAKKSKLPGTR